MARHPIKSAPILLGLLLLTGCAAPASQMLTSPEDMLAQRQLQTRHYESADEERILMTCTALLQDMGFQIDEGTSRLGVVLGSKMRDANSLTPGQRVAVGAAALGLLAGGYTAPLALLLVDKIQAKPVRIEVGVFTRKIGVDGDRIAVRIIFRETGHTDGRPGPPHIIADATVYQEAFDRLSKALALEARES
jgi:hypothetical protein